MVRSMNVSKLAKYQLSNKSPRRLKHFCAITVVATCLLTLATAKRAVYNSPFQKLANDLGINRRRLTGAAPATNTTSINVDQVQAKWWNKGFKRHGGQTDKGFGRGSYIYEMLLGGVIIVPSAYFLHAWVTQTLPFFQYQVQLADQLVGMPGIKNLKLYTSDELQPGIDGVETGTQSTHNVLFDTKNTLIDVVNDVSALDPNLKACDIDFEDYVDSFDPFGYCMGGTLFITLLVFGSAYFLGFNIWMTLFLTFVTFLTGIFVYAGFKQQMCGIAEVYQEVVIEKYTNTETLLSDPLNDADVLHELETLQHEDLLEFEILNEWQIASIVMASFIGLFLIWAIWRKFRKECRADF